MVLRLLGRELADRREDTEGIAGEHDDVARLLVDHAGDLRVRDELDRVRATSVLRNGDVLVVGFARDGVVDDVLEDATEANGVVDLGLLLARETDTLGVTATLDVEDTVVGPDVLVVTDEQTLRVCAQRRLTRSREAEEERDIALLLADVRGRVQR